MVIVRKISGKNGSCWRADISYIDATGQWKRTRRRVHVKTRDEALAWAAEQQRKLAQGIDEGTSRAKLRPGPISSTTQELHPPSIPESAEPTLASFAERFLKFCASPAATSKGSNSLGEMQEKRRTLELHLVPAFGHMRLSDFKSMHFDNYIVEKSQGAKPLSNSTIANHLIVMRRLLTVAHRWELIDRVPHIAIPPKKQKREFLSPDELDRFLGAAGDWLLFFLFASRAGLRVGELIVLERRDVSLNPPQVYVQRAWSRGAVKLPKSGKARRVPLAPSLAAAVAPTLTMGRPCDLMFPGPAGTQLTHRMIYKAMLHIAKTAGISRHIHPHMLRHTFGTHLASTDVPLRAVQEWMGHSDIQTTMGYSHAAPTITDRFIDRVDQLSDFNSQANRKTI